MTHLTRLAYIIFPTLLIGLSCGVAAQAQNNRSFISGTGSDANPCTFTLPCRNAQRAHDMTNPGGEINVLDPAGYGSLTIRKAVSIQGHGWGELVGAGGANAVTINAGTSDDVNLSGLVIEGFGSGNTGIVFNSGRLLTINKCVVHNFESMGILIVPGASARFWITDTIVSNIFLNDGIRVEPTGSAVVAGSIERVKANNNNVGISVSGGFTTGATVQVTVVDSEASMNSSLGIVSLSFAGRAATLVTVRGTTVSFNNIGLSPQGSTIQLSHSVVTGNATGIAVFSGGTLATFGDNNISGNTTTDGAPTSFIPPE